MLTVLFYLCAGIAIFFGLLTFFFDIWVYVTTKDIDYVLQTWAKSNEPADSRLLPTQIALLKFIRIMERVLKYIFYFLLVPVILVLLFKLMGINHG